MDLKNVLYKRHPKLNVLDSRVMRLEASRNFFKGETHMMKIPSVLLVVVSLLGGAASAQELKKLSLDDISVVSPKIQSDGSVKVEGKSSIKITTRWPTTVMVGEVEGLDIENAKLIYKAKVKTEIDGVAFLELWAHVGGGQYFSKGMNDTVKGKSDWKTIQTPFLFQKGQRPDKVTLNVVINGTGTIWIDDVVLSKEPLQ